MKSVTRRCTTCRQKVSTEKAIIGALKAFCSYECLSIYTKSERGQKAVQKAVQSEYKTTRQVRKEKLKTRSDRIREAQTAFNRYVRLRDVNKPCISCGSMPEQKVGGTRDCGHYLSRGAHSQHRFRLDNVASQCVKCNRYLSGNVAHFRLGLIERWGEDRITLLECDNYPRKFSEAYLIRLKDIFNRKANLYQRKFR